MKRSCLLLIALIVLSFGCKEEEGGLTGSLGDFYDLTYDDVRARLYRSEFAIEYVKQNDEVPIRLSINLADAMLGPGEYDLEVLGDITGRARDIDVPRLVAGTMTLEQAGVEDGARILGKFEARFETGKDEASLAGDFDTTLEVIEQIQGYEYRLPDGAIPPWGDVGFLPDGALANPPDMDMSASAGD